MDVPEAFSKTPTTSIALVKLVYESLRAHDFHKLKEIVTEDVTWNVTEGFPYAGIYKGLDNVLRGFYARFRSHLDSFAAEHVKWIDAGESVIVLGYYLMTTKSTTEESRIRFAHIWGIRDGKVTGVWQVADTAKLPQVFSPH
jgi:uncharacterized protein